MRRLVLGGLALLLAAWMIPVWFVWSELPGLLTTPLEPVAAIGSLSAERCGACHLQIKLEWEKGHHAQAITDPMYVEDLKSQGAPYFCNYCHAPLVEQQPKITWGLAAIFPIWVPLQRDNPRYDPTLHQEGITCVVCHQVGGVIEGPHEVTAPHPTRATVRLRSESLCEPCHTLDLTRIGSLERPLMETVKEWRRYREKGGEKSCIDCHLPQVGARSSAPGAPARAARSHHLLGPFDLELLLTAVEVKSFELHFQEGGVIAEVTLFNATGHHLPTAEPHRSVVIALEGFDGDRAIGRNQVELSRRIDLSSLSEVPGADTTLRPRETRALTLVASSTGAPTKARLSIDFRLWDPADETLTRRIYQEDRTRQ